MTPAYEPILSRILLLLPILAVVSLSEMMALVAIILPWGTK